MILCIGTTPTAQRSMTFDRLTIDDVNRATEVSEYASGKSINVARVLKTLGHSPFCTGFLGGVRASLIRQDLDSLHIPHDFVTTSSPTRLCTTLIDRSNHTATELVEESSPVPPAAWTSLDRTIRSLGRGASTWVISGSLPPTADSNTYARWIQMAHDANATVILDARGQSVRQALLLGNFILKLNRDELDNTFYFDLPMSFNGMMHQAIPKGGAVIVTLGKKGAIASDGQQTWQVTTPGITSVSAIGSGDSFAAGLAAALHDRLPLPDALKLAAACGTANALTDRAGHLHQRDVDHILSQTIVSPT